MATDKTFSDTERLEWAIRNPYAFREIYLRFDNKNLELFRATIDEYLTAEKAQRTKS